jgi:hypothetical protein
VIGAANYIFKHTRRPERKAELTPANFRGRMYTASKGFLTKPFKALWGEAKEAKAKRMAPKPLNSSADADANSTASAIRAPVAQRPLA